MAKLTDEQIDNVAEKCECGYFEYGDAQGKVRFDFARAIETACQANEVDFPILRIIEKEHLRNGAAIKIQGCKVCLADRKGEIIGQSDTLQGLLTELIFILC